MPIRRYTLSPEDFPLLLVHLDNIILNLKDQLFSLKADKDKDKDINIDPFIDPFINKGRKRKIESL